MDTDLQKQINELKEKISILEQKRIYQQDIIPQAVKNRHMGEGNTYIYGGLSANRPTAGTTIKAGNTVISISAYFETDTNKLYIFNGTIWVSTTLS